MTTKYDPIPYLRWFKLFPNSTPVLQVGYRPINGGQVEYRDVPTVIQWLSEDEAQGEDL